MARGVVGFGSGRISRKNWLDDHADEAASPSGREECTARRSREMLFRALNLHTVVMLCGSGLTSGRYGGWAALVKEAIKAAREGKRPDQMVRFAGLSPEDPRHSLWVLQAVQQHWGEQRVVHRHPHEQPLESGHERAHGTPDARGSAEFTSLHEWLSNRYSPSRAVRDNRGVPAPIAAFAPLFRLQVRKYATTNYDAEIEWELAAKEGALNRAQFERMLRGEGSPHNFPDPGFTQLRHHAQQLAEFAVATRNRERALVFHLHGRFDSPDSLIATESDYRSFYLRPDSDAGQLFRHSVQLLLTSNPILFVGFGLKDPDFMRTLEFLRAADEPFGDERAAFALLPTCELADAFFLRPAPRKGAPLPGYPATPVELALDYFWQRYGVHVIPYRCDSAGDIGRRFPLELARLEEEWLEWRKGWVLKPKWRPPQRAGSSSEPFVHPDIVPSRSSPIGETAVERDMKELKGWLESRVAASVIVLLGPGGCGKSFRALRLGNRLGRFRRFFFWSTYYADDWLTGVDALLGYLEQGSRGARGGTRGGKSPARPRSRLERLRAALNNPKQRALIVFDGFERVLVQSQSAAEGSPKADSAGASPAARRDRELPIQPAELGGVYSTAVRKFLEVISGAMSSTVVLTSRLWPEPLAVPKDDRSTETPIRLMRVRPLTAADIAGKRGEFTRADVCANRICSLLDGHAYSLRLARWLIESRARGDSWDLCESLTWIPPHGRLGKVIDLCIERIGKYWDEQQERGDTPAGKDVVRRVIEHLSVFMSPIAGPVWETCLGPAGVRDFGRFKELVEQRLADSGLVECVKMRAGEDGYTLHPIVRGHVFHRLHGSKSQEMPNFTLPGFTTGTSAVDPGDEQGRRVVCALFDELYRQSREAAAAPARREAAVGFCRAAFSVMRSRMDAIAAARWDRYQPYIERSVRLANLVKRLAGMDATDPTDMARGARRGLWDFAERSSVGPRSVCSEGGVLHAEELAWLINDLGLACCCEGNMYDALAVWTYGYEINRLIEHGEAGGQFTVQSQLHLGHAYMELGELAKAREYLLLTEKTNQVHGSADYAARINGYMGVLEHLSGDAKAAARRYKAALDGLSGNANARATSIFLRHRADLYIWTGETDKAAQLARRALGIAQAGGHPDLAAFAHNTIGHVRRRVGDLRAARVEYDMSLRDARRIGIRRLEADVLSELARLALDQREPEMARTNAMRSLRIANECGLGLRQCHALVVLGLATDMAGNRELGVEYLRVARRLCERAGYWLRMQEADHQLHAWGVEPKGTERSPF